VHDWFDLFWSLEKLQHKFEYPLHIIFLDGHAAGHIDEPWRIIFNATVNYISAYQPEMLCFERVVWMPKASPLWQHIKPQERPCGIMDRFVERVLNAYQIVRPKPEERTMDVIIDRQPYVSHPRVDLGAQKNDRYIPDLAGKFPEYNVVEFEALSFREQLHLVVHARSLTGVHGAGLTHLMWMGDGAEATEWIANSRRGYNPFAQLASWRPGITFHRIEFPRNRLKGGK